MSEEPPFWIDHVGIVVRDLEPWIDRFARLLRIDRDAVTVSTVRDPESGELVEAAFIVVGPNRLEFICPRPGSTSRFARHLDEKGEGLFHISLYVSEFAQVIDDWRATVSPIDVLTVKMSSTSLDPDAVPDRIVDIAWVPPEHTGGVNVEYVDAHPPPVSPR